MFPITIYSIRRKEQINMSKYNLNSNSDMRKFTKDLEKSLLNSVRGSALKGTYDVDCPHCKKKFSAHSGLNRCPHCGEEVDLKLNINF